MRTTEENRPICPKGVVPIKRRSFIALIVICLFMLSGITAYAANPVTPKTKFSYRGTDITASIESVYRSDKAFFKDEAELLSSAQERDLWEKLQSTADYLNVNLAVFIGGNYRTDEETVDFTIDCTAQLFGAYSDTLFVYIDFEGYSPAYDYVRAFNNADTIYPETKRNKILNIMYQDLPASTEPIYADSIKKAIANGIDEIKSQGYVNNAATVNNTYPDNGYNTYDPEPMPPRQEDHKTNDPIGEFFAKVPGAAIIGVIIILVVLLVISSIVRSIKRKVSGIGSSFRRNTYNTYNSYNDHDTYYGRGSSYYHGYSHSRHNPPPPPPPPGHSAPPSHSRSYGSSHSSRPSKSHSSPSRSSSRSSGTPHSSGSGHHR